MTYNINFANGESVQLEFDSSIHQYRLAESEEVIPSATQILSVIAKPALVYWAASESAKSFKNSAVELKNLSEKIGINPVFTFGDAGIDAAMFRAINAHKKISEEAATIGSQVHNFIEKTIKNEAVDLPLLPKAQKSCEAFLQWYEDHPNVRILECEEKVYHPELKYAGTVDAVAEIDGDLYIIDFKTSSKVYPEHHIQCAAYAKAIELMMGKEVHHTMILRFDKRSGKYHTSVSSEINENFIAFRSAMVLHRRLHRGNRAKGKKKDSVG
jgi:genome maintenance exonuclease 1